MHSPTSRYVTIREKQNRWCVSIGLEFVSGSGTICVVICSAKSLFMSLYYFSRIITQYIIDEVNNYLSTTSYKLDFSVSR